MWGFLTFCHPYGWHSFVCQFYARSYTIAIANSEPSTLLPLSLMCHARSARQHGIELESPNLAREMTTLPSPPSFVASWSRLGQTPSTPAAEPLSPHSLPWRRRRRLGWTWWRRWLPLPFPFLQRTTTILGTTQTPLNPISPISFPNLVC